MNKEWFKAQFKNVGKPQSELASALNVEPSAISRALNGSRRFKADEIATIADFFNVPATDVIWAIKGKHDEKPPALLHADYIKTDTVGEVNISNNGKVSYFKEENKPCPIIFRPPHQYKDASYIGLKV